MGFGEDLMSIGYALFRLTEIVGERSYDELDIIADKRIERLIAASDNLKGMLYRLQIYFSKDPDDHSLMVALASVKHITDYLLQSFQAALAYKLPYAEHNPFGLSVDISQIDDRKDCKLGEIGGNTNAKVALTELVVNLHRLLGMQILMVHHFSMEFAVLVAHVRGCRSGTLLDLASEDKFEKLMQKLHKYQQGIRSTMEGAHDGGGDDLTEDERVLFRALSGVVDLDMTFIGNDEPLAAVLRQWLVDRNAIPLFHRQLVFHNLLLGLQLYEVESNEDNVKRLFKHTERLYLELLPVEQCFPTRFMETNPRERLAKKFRQFTSTPCYEYQAKPSVELGGRREFTLSKGDSGMDVQRRKVVNVWKRKLQWNRFDWELFTVAHGETHLMVNLIHSLAPIILANKRFRTSRTQDPAVMHSMLTRFFGPFYAIDAIAASPAHIEGMRAIEVIDDPVYGRNSSIQPMPADIQEWAKNVYRVYVDNARHYVSDAVFAPATSLSGAEQIPASKVKVHEHNVRWLRLKLAPADQQFTNAYKFVNSLFLIHYGNALLAIDTPSGCHGTVSVLGADAAEPMRLHGGRYEEYNHSTIGTNADIQYKHPQRIIAEIAALQERFLLEFKGKNRGFLHPTCWMQHGGDQGDGHGYVKCTTRDVTSGVHIVLPAENAEEEDEADEELNEAMERIQCDHLEVGRAEEGQHCAQQNDQPVVIGLTPMNRPPA